MTPTPNDWVRFEGILYSRAEYNRTLRLVAEGQTERAKALMRRVLREQKNRHRVIKTNLRRHHGKS